jgi:hypothetical protein
MMQRQQETLLLRQQSQCGDTRFPVPSMKVEYGEKDKCWNVEASYFEKKLLLKIDAVTGNMSSFKVEKISGEK